MDFSRKKVLVVEMDVIVLALVTHILSRQGYIVEAKSSPADAPAAARGSSFDAAVIDFDSASTADGWLTSLLDSAPGLRGRIIAVGKSVPTGLPVREHLQKPIELGALIDAVGRCVRRRAD